MTTIHIPARARVECKCGAQVEVTIPGCRGGVSSKCECGNWVRAAWSRGSLCEVFGLFGVKLGADWDGELTAESEAELSDEMQDWLFEHQSQLRGELESDRRLAMLIYMGGSRNGQPHRKWRVSGYDWPVHVHIARGHWEVYVWRGRDDPRLWYVGRATSEAKAKKRVFVDAGGDDATG